MQHSKNTVPNQRFPLVKFIYCHHKERKGWKKLRHPSSLKIASQHQEKMVIIMYKKNHLLFLDCKLQFSSTFFTKKKETSLMNQF